MTWKDIMVIPEQVPNPDPIERLADAIAACVAKGSSDYGAKRNELKRLLVEFAREVLKKVGEGR